MNVEVVNNEKGLLELKVDDITIAEVLRSYLNKNGVEFAAWRREHPDKPIVFRIQVSSGTVKKAVSDAVSAIKKDLADFEKVLKK